MAIRFEWDEAKNLANLRKHGIRFEEAARVFADENWVPVFDRIVDGEERWHAIGWVQGIRLVLVVHTGNEELAEPVIRIISARRANRREERIYEEQNG